MSASFEDSDFADVEWAAPARQDLSRGSMAVVWAAVLAILAGIPGLAWGIHLLWG